MMEMGENSVAPSYVTIQPVKRNVVRVNPFYDYENDWSISLCNCCEDVGQCEQKTC